MLQGKARWIAAAGVVAGALAAAPATASATITTTDITSPSSPSFQFNDHDSPGTIAVMGTTDSDDTANDKVDLQCFYDSTPDSLTLATDVDLNPDGSFSVPAAALDGIELQVCRLRAVPAGTIPADLTPFTGPVVATGEKDPNSFYTVNSGPNTGSLFDYYIYGQGVTAAADYDSYGSCGYCDGYLYDSTLDETTTTFYANDTFPSSNADNTRSAVQVDGVNALSPGVVGFGSLNQGTGLPALTYDYSFNPANGNLTITESDPLVRCPDPSIPPNNTKCSTYSSVGVRVDRTITQEQDAHLSFVTDRYVSTDGQQHSIDLQPDNVQNFNSSPDVAEKFPGESSFSSHNSGDVVNFPGSAPAAIYINVPGSPDGDPTTGQGAIVFDRPATPARFTYYGEMFLQQNAVVTASCSPTFSFAYAQDYLEANVQSLAQTAINRFNASPPTVCSAPPSGGGGGGSAGTPATTAGKDPKCQKLRRKLKRQGGQRRRALEPRRSQIQSKMARTRARIKKLGC